MAKSITPTDAIAKEPKSRHDVKSPRKRTKKKTTNTSSSKSHEKQTKEVETPVYQAPPHRQLLNLLADFLYEAECTREMFQCVLPVLEAQDKRAVESMFKAVGALKKEAKTESPRASRVLQHTKTMMRHAKKLHRAEVMFRANALVGIISRYDHFLASVLRRAYVSYPDHLESVERTLTYSDVKNLDSVDKIVETFISKEVDALMRESHREQIAKLDSEFKLGIAKSFTEIDFFIEATERRNLLVHNGGVVSKAYLQKCKEAGLVQDDLPSLGDHLDVSEDYISKFVLIVSELAVRLGFALAFRLFPGQCSEINGELLEIGFTRLQLEDWELARRIFQFAAGLPEKYIQDDLTCKLYLINTAVALDNLGRNEEAKNLLGQCDWSAMAPQFLLAEAVVRHDWKTAEKLMSKMSPTTPFEEDDYRDWPVFKQFRHTKEFRNAFKNVYGKRFVVRLSKEEVEVLQAKTQQRTGTKTAAK